MSSASLRPERELYSPIPSALERSSSSSSSRPRTRFITTASSLLKAQPHLNLRRLGMAASEKSLRPCACATFLVLPCARRGETGAQQKAGVGTGRHNGTRERT